MRHQRFVKCWRLRRFQKVLMPVSSGHIAAACKMFEINPRADLAGLLDRPIPSRIGHVLPLARISVILLRTRRSAQMPATDAMAAIQLGIGSSRPVLLLEEITLTLALAPLACHTVWHHAHTMSLPLQNIRNAQAQNTHRHSARVRAVKKGIRRPTGMTRSELLRHTVCAECRKSRPN